jgi:nucleotide-binding universal stress UspA family protein
MRQPRTPRGGARGLPRARRRWELRGGAARCAPSASSSRDAHDRRRCRGIRALARRARSGAPDRRALGRAAARLCLPGRRAHERRRRRKLRWPRSWRAGTTPRCTSCRSSRDQRPSTPSWAVDPQSAVAARRIRERPLDDLHRVVAELGPGLDADGVVVCGDPAEELVRASSSADLMVAGSRGFAALHAVLAGAVSGRLIRAPACPVIVVPPPPVRAMTATAR